MSQWRNLVFSGGGIKGIAYVGALHELNEEGVLHDIKRVAGTSSGSITAAAVALGCTIEETYQILKETNFSNILDHDTFFINNIYNLFKNYGWHKGKAFEDWFRSIIKNKVGRDDVTFKDVPQIAGKYLYVTGTDLKYGITQVFSHETHPDMGIAEAVQISTSIPLFFQSVNHGGVQYVDGAVLRNYPINIFDNVKYVEDSRAAAEVDYAKGISGYVYNKETLGFRLGSQEETKADLNERGKVQRISGLVSYAWALVGSMFEAANRSHLHKNDWHRTIYLDSLGVKATDFSITEEMTSRLIDSGKLGVQSYLKWFNDTSDIGGYPLNKVLG